VDAVIIKFLALPIIAARLTNGIPTSITINNLLFSLLHLEIFQSPLSKAVSQCRRSPQTVEIAVQPLVPHCFFRFIVNSLMVQYYNGKANMSRYSAGLVSRGTNGFSNQFRAFHTTTQPSIVLVALYRALVLGNTLITRPLQHIIQCFRNSHSSLSALKRTALHFIGRLLAHNTKLVRFRNYEVLTGNVNTDMNNLPTMRGFTGLVSNPNIPPPSCFTYTFLSLPTHCRPSLHLHLLKLHHNQI